MLRNKKRFAFKLCFKNYLLNMHNNKLFEIKAFENYLLMHEHKSLRRSDLYIYKKANIFISEAFSMND